MASDRIQRESPAAVLAEINAGFAALLHREPAELVLGADRSLGDALVVCGILGGKDVGKSTLINALAGRPVSPPEEEVGEGTTRPRAFIHRAALDAYARRFNGRARPFDVREHDVERLRNVVLVDMPDFDSDLPAHADTVRAAAPLLDRIIWVLTPRKIVDRQWIGLLVDVLKDNRNVHVVLNKADELLDDEADRRGFAEDFWQRQRDWAEGVLCDSGCAAIAGCVFLLAAWTPTREAFVERIASGWNDPDWSRFAADRDAIETIARNAEAELDRLRGAVLGPVDAGEAAAIKQANRTVEVRASVERLERHYELSAVAESLDRACDLDACADLLDDCLGSGYCAEAAAGLETGLRPESDLAEELLSRRIESWGLLRAVYWPLRWLVRRIGGRVAGTAPSTPVSIRPLDVRGRTLSERIELFHERFAAEHARLVRRMRLSPGPIDPAAVADRVARRALELPRDLDRALAERLAAEARPPGRITRAALGFLLVWFTLGQPFAEGLLRVAGAGGKMDLLGGLLQVVVALSATHLLKAAAMVLLIYVLVLAWLYSRCVLAVRRGRSVEVEANDTPSRLLARQIEALLATELAEPAIAPFLESRATFAALHARLHALATVTHEPSARM